MPRVTGLLGAALRRAATATAARAAARIDERVIDVMERRMRRSAAPAPEDARQRLLELAAHYRRPDTLGLPSAFFPEPAAAALRETPARPRRDGAVLGPDVRVVDLAFPSTYRPFLPGFADELARTPENLTAHARLYSGGRGRPVAICLHGWGGGAYWLEERAFAVDYWLRHGLDVALFQLPYHGQRAPRPAPGQERAGALFPSANLPRTNEAFGQAIHDLRALAAALRGRGAPAIGVMGMSLGGYTTALWASLDDQLAFAVPMIPAVAMDDLMWRHGGDSPARRRAERLGVGRDLVGEVFAVHAPLSRPVRLPAERLLVVAGEADRITPPDQAEALWRHWGQPEIVWFPGGHLAQIGRSEAFRAMRRRFEALGLTARAAGPARRSGPAPHGAAGDAGIR